MGTYPNETYKKSMFILGDNSEEFDFPMFLLKLEYVLEHWEKKYRKGRQPGKGEL